MKTNNKSMLAGVALAALATLATGSLAQAASWNIQNDFSGIANPMGQWSLGWEQAGGGAFNLYDSHTSVQWWASNHRSGDNTPTVWKNTSSNTAYGIQGGEIAVHPGWDGSYSVVRWTSLHNGTVSVAGTFGAGDGGAMSYYIALNGAPPLLLSDFNNGGSRSFSYDLAITNGATLDFMVGTGAGGYGWGNTALAVNIVDTTPTPEPATLLLLGSGLAGLLGARRKQRV